MPVDAGASRHGAVSQREQYAKGGLSRRYWDWRDQRVLDELGEGRRILDVGCGEGLLLEKARRRFPDRDLQGVDIDPLNVRICREHGLPARQGSCDALPYPDAGADACLFVEVIEHLSRPEVALRELARVLRPGGRLVLVFPNDRTFFLARLAMGMWKEAGYDSGHLRQWTPRAIHGALASAGFSVLRQRSLPVPFFALALHHLVVAQRRPGPPP